MKTRTVTVREGELLGPIDWDHESFAKSDHPRHAENLAAFRAMAEGFERGEDWQATTDGGWPRMCWRPLIAVGMYDGWPYWKPMPSFCTRSPLGGAEWHHWSMLTGAEAVSR